VKHVLMTIGFCCLVQIGTACDPAIYFFERPANVKIYFETPSELEIQYWERDGPSDVGADTVSAVAAALIPDAQLPVASHHQDVFVIEMNGRWRSESQTTLSLNGRAAYEAVFEATGESRQGFSFCVPDEVSFEMAADPEAFDVGFGCAVWSISEPVEAPTISLRTMPAVSEASLSLVLAAIGAGAGISMSWLLLRRRSLRPLRSLLLGAVPLVVVVVIVGWFAGAVLAFDLVGLGFVTWVASVTFSACLISSLIGIVFVVRAFSTTPIPDRPDLGLSE
jgi:hypothetical protein